EAGAAQVELFARAPELKRLQPFRWMSNAGFMRHIHALDDEWRWRLLRHILELREAVPQETWERGTRFRNFRLYEGSPWLDTRVVGDRLAIVTPRGLHQADFAIAATGLDVDLLATPLLAPFAERIALWSDRYTPPVAEQSERLARYPYL